ncbi:MAG TPA: FMN-binding negative transcriptional regulator [Bryobacteraceae bacterium]|nr:FMN-binding negative transcriptional regulator [Bryobacteraceae bacterium]
MYTPAHFREDRPDVLRDLIGKYPLAALVTIGPDGLEANHIPLLFDPDPAPHGTLRGHLSRANRQWQNLRPDVEALAIFQGPQAYISPNWYPTKQETGRVVPTWNYAVVHAYGSLRVYDDPARLRSFLDRLTAIHEAKQPVPWKPADAPPEYIEGLLKAIVGIELTITRLEGKWKVSQNQPAENRAGVAAALTGTPMGALL